MYTCFVEFMRHAKFQAHMTFGSGEDYLRFYHIYRRGGHLGHVTCNIYTNFRSLFPSMLNMMALTGQTISRRCLKIYRCCMPSFKILIGYLVLENTGFKGFYQILAWRTSWSWELDNVCKLPFPFPMPAPYVLWLCFT